MPRNIEIANRNAVVLALLTLLLASLGCRKFEEIVTRSQPVQVERRSAGDGGDADNSVTEPDDSEHSLTRKTNLYISECFNKYSNRIAESYNRYALWVGDMDKGPTGRETLVYGLYEISGDGSDCADAVEKARLIEPAIPEVEEAAAEYVTALSAIVPKINDIYRYYDQDDYRDDKFAKGKAAHPSLHDSFKAFRAASDKFGDHVDKLEDQVAESQYVGLIGVPGRRFEALTIESGIKSKKIKNIVRSDEDKINVDELNSLIDDFDKTVVELRSAENKPNTAMLFLDACDEFTKASKELMRRKREGSRLTEFERGQIAAGAGWMVDGSAAKVIRAYNTMISRRSFAKT